MTSLKRHSLALPPPALFLHTLGEALVTLNDQPLDWPAKSAEDLLWFLHAHPEGAYRTRLLRELWGLEDTAPARNRFRVALHRLRSTLGWTEAVIEVRGRYQLHPDLLAASDTAALSQHLQVAAAAHTDAEREAALRNALRCGAGEYLPQIQAEWVERARAEHQAARLQAYVELAAIHCGRRECLQAAACLGKVGKALAADPLIGEQHHQRMMICLVHTRGRFEAVTHYRRYCQYLRTEVGDTPMPETVALAERVKAGERPCHAANVPAQSGVPLTTSC